MSVTVSPKAELLNTLETMRKTLDNGDQMLHVRVAQIGALLDHALTMAALVGESKGRRAKPRPA